MALTNEQIGEAHVLITADIDQLKKDFAKIQKRTTNTANTMSKKFDMVRGRINKVSGAFKKFIAVAVVAAGAGALGNLVRTTLDTVDALDKVASKLGVSTDFLQKAQFAAEQSGVAFNTLSMAMQRYIRRAGEANQGTGEAQNAIIELGLELRNTNGTLKSTEVLFTEALRALSKVDNAADKARLAQKIFDSEGVSLVNLAGNFDTLAKQAEDSGIIIDEFVIKKGVAAKDELNLLSKIVKANLTGAVVDISPLLIDLGNALSFAAEWAGELWARFKDVQDLGLRGLNMKLSDLEKQLDSAREHSLFLLEAFTQLSAEKGGVINEMLIREASAAFSEAEADYEGLLAKYTSLKARIERFEAETPKNVASNASINEPTKAEREARKKQIDTIRGIELAWLRATDQREAAINLETDDAIEALEELKLSTEEFTTAKTQLHEIAAKRIEELHEKEKSFGTELWDNFSDNASSALSQMVIDGEVSFKKLGDIFMQEVTHRILKTFVFDQIFSGFTSVFGAGGFGRLNLPNVPGRATGGPVFSGSSYIVGERGVPEVFTPHSSGTITPLGGGAPMTVVNIHNNTKEKSGVEESEGPNGERMIEVWIGSFGAKDVIQGGPMSRAFESTYDLSRRGERRG
jgi:hypothetical protein